MPMEGSRAPAARGIPTRLYPKAHHRFCLILLKVAWLSWMASSTCGICAIQLELLHVSVALLADVYVRWRKRRGGRGILPYHFTWQDKKSLALLSQGLHETMKAAVP